MAKLAATNTNDQRDEDTTFPRLSPRKLISSLPLLSIQLSVFTFETTTTVTMCTHQGQKNYISLPHMPFPFWNITTQQKMGNCLQHCKWMFSFTMHINDKPQ